MSPFKKIALPLILSAFLFSDGPRLFAQGEKLLVIEGARVLKGDGLFWDRCQVVIRNGKIEEVAPEAKIPEGAAIVEGRGKWLIPGLIDVFVFPTTLVGEKLEKSDYFTPREKITDALNPEKYPLQSPRVWEILKIHNERFKNALRRGVITLLLVPDETKIISGLAGIIKLKPEDTFLESSLVSESFAIKIGLERKKVEGLQSHMGIVWGIREFFLKEKYSGPVLIETNTEEEIARALSLHDEFRLQTVFFGKMDCLPSFSEISGRKIPVILRSPGLAEVEGFGKKLSTLLGLGVESALYSDGNVMDPLRVLISLKPWLKEEEIHEKELYKLITSDFAKILGVSQRLGSIEKGKDADFVILDGDPLGPTTKVEKVFIEGKVVYEAGKGN